MTEMRALVCDYCGSRSSRSSVTFPWVEVELYRRVSDVESPQTARATFCCGECAAKWVRDEVVLWDVSPRWARYAPLAEGGIL